MDAGCGTGVHLPTLERLGWSVVGVDLSADQLGIARTRSEGVILADAGCLPIATGTAARCVSVLTLTDLDDVGPFFAEAARILQPDGELIVISTHPCFIGPFAKLEGGSDGTIQIFPGYRNTERVFQGPGLGSGIRSRVGVRHVPLAELLNKLIRAGLHLIHVEEPGEVTTPWLFSLIASTQLTVSGSS